MDAFSRFTLQQALATYNGMVTVLGGGSEAQHRDGLNAVVLMVVLTAYAVGSIRLVIVLLPHVSGSTSGNSTRRTALWPARLSTHVPAQATLTGLTFEAFEACVIAADLMMSM